MVMVKHFLLNKSQYTIHVYTEGPGQVFKLIVSLVYSLCVIKKSFKESSKTRKFVQKKVATYFARLPRSYRRRRRICVSLFVLIN